MSSFPMQRLVSCFCLFFLIGAVRGQQIDSTLARYSANFAQERVYLHYDKSVYYPGETVWFKAYLMKDIFPADESKTLYVDWIDEKGTVLQHTVSPVVDASTNGQFDIPAAFTGNVVHVRAYTRWMLNFDTAFLYARTLRILPKTIPAPGAAKNTSPAAAPAPTVTFFPEGGQAVTGIPTRIAFKAVDATGRPVRVRGQIRSDKGEVVDSFRTIHDGLGSVMLTPLPGQTYTARWKDEKGKEYTTPLPAVQTEGIGLRLTFEGTRRRFTVTRSEPGDRFKQVHVVGTMHEQLVFKANLNLSNSNTSGGLIPVEQFPTGVLTVTVFDASWKPLAERIIFINNGEYGFNPAMEVQRWGLSKRARNEVRISIPDSIISDLSVAVTDAAIGGDSSRTIVSELLLSGELKGDVWQPAYYFRNNHDTTRQHLDLVMMTHGWRRIKWADVAAGKLPAITYPRDTAYLTLSGRLYGLQAAQLRDAGSIVLMVKQKDTSTKLMFEPVEPDGTFRDPQYIFFDTLRLYYQLPKFKGRSQPEVQFMSDRLPAPNYTRRLPPSVPVYADTTGNAYQARMAAERARLEEQFRGKTLEGVTVTARTKPTIQVMDEKYTSGLFRGLDSYQFDLVNDPGASSYYNIFQYLQGKVAGLQITSNGGNTSMQWRNSTPEVFLDEIRTDVDMIASIPVNDVAYVKVFRPPFIGAPGGGQGGAIAIYTRRGNDLAATPGKGLSANTIAGYTAVREFYSPNYASFNQRNEEPDIRTTIYWNPRVILGGRNRTATLVFYNNDVTKAFRVVIEGMTADGRLAHVEQMME